MNTFGQGSRTFTTLFVIAYSCLALWFILLAAVPALCLPRAYGTYANVF
jgi:hypothetical protein